MSSAQLTRVMDRVHGTLKESDGEKLLDDVRSFISRFCIFPDEHCLVTVALWAAHAHAIDHFHTTPRLALLSPEPASGKTRVLEVLDLLVPKPLFALNASAAAVFRTLAKDQITLLFDEVDAIWKKKGKDDGHEDLRALLNAGYRVGATIPRCVGPAHNVERFKVSCAVALAGLGELPETIMSRSLIIRMQRRRPGQQIEEFRVRRNAPEGALLRERLAAWASDIGQAAGTAWPKLPSGIVDRPAEIWEPLIAIADAAGGHWPETARQACVSMCRAAQDRTVSLGIRLLSDLRTIFKDADALHTATILERLTSGEDLDADAPWSDLRGKPLSVRGLANMLKQYGIHPVKLREHLGPARKGYRREALWDAWQRYLPPLFAEGEHGEHCEQSDGSPGCPSSSNGGTAAPHTGREILTPEWSAPDVPHVPLWRDTPSTCPACDGEGCRRCGDSGRIQ